MIEKVENYMDRSMLLRYLQTVFTYFSPVTLIITAVLTLWRLNYNRKRARLVHLIEKIPGPPALPFIGKFRKFIISKVADKFLHRQCN